MSFLAAINVRSPLIGSLAKLSLHSEIFVPASIMVRHRSKDHKYWNPQKIPARYRVPKSPYQKKQAKENRSNDLGWSTGDKTHPLPEDRVTQDYPQQLPDGGLKYYGFEYYPRDPNNVDSIPKEEISPLFMVRRTTTYKDKPWYYKAIFDEIGLNNDMDRGGVVIVKNVPEMNEKLYFIKGYIEITALQLPADLPLDADPAHCSISEHGVFTYDPVHPIPDYLLKKNDEIEKFKLDKGIILGEGRRAWFGAWDLKL